MDSWSLKKVIVLVILGVILCAAIAVPVVIINMKSLPDLEEYKIANNLDNVLNEFERVYIEYGDQLKYYEKKGEYFNYADGVSSDKHTNMTYVLNGNMFWQLNNNVYYCCLFDRDIPVPGSGSDPFTGVNRMLTSATDVYKVKKDKGNYIMTFRVTNPGSGNLADYELYFNNELYIYDMTIDIGDKIIRQEFTYGEEINYPEFIKNYETGERVKVTLINLLANKTEEFEVKKGSLILVDYNTEKGLELYKDEACTIVYGADCMSTEPINEAITLYISRKAES